MERDSEQSPAATILYWLRSHSMLMRFLIAFALLPVGLLRIAIRGIVTNEILYLRNYEPEPISK